MIYFAFAVCGWYPIHEWLKTVKKLLKTKLFNGLRGTPLHYAAENSHFGAYELL